MRELSFILHCLSREDVESCLSMYSVYAWIIASFPPEFLSNCHYYLNFSWIKHNFLIYHDFCEYIVLQLGFMCLCLLGGPHCSPDSSQEGSSLVLSKVLLGAQTGLELAQSSCLSAEIAG